MLFTFLTTNTYLEHLLSFVPSSLVLALLIVGVSNRTSQDNHGLIKRRGVNAMIPNAVWAVLALSDE
ncbi:Hypothetical protein Cp106_1624 [Corynebacterium pseudotuberculosis 1/06-A]|nr:Hypothetical protein Cp106_1624 [Corynebacterium pseudotuberculosis 1/06-A]